MLLEFHTEYELAPGGEPDAGVKLIVPLPLDEFKQTEVVSIDMFPGGDDIKVYEADSLFGNVYYYDFIWIIIYYECVGR